MNKRIRKKQRRNRLLEEAPEFIYTLSGMKKMAKEWVYNFPYKGRYTGRGLGTAYYYKLVGTVPAYTQRPKFRRRKTWEEFLLTGAAGAYCIWSILADREARVQYLQRRKGSESA